MSDDRLSVEPGHIWLIEQSGATALSPLARGALNSANVVIYDRVLAPLVARHLPIGSYAEPLSHTAQADPGLAPRALKFAAEGWSVVQLVAARPRWRDLAAATGGHNLPVRVIAEPGNDAAPTLVFGPLGGRPPGAAYAFTANGLAG